jgi:hypothetical protein
MEQKWGRFCQTILRAREAAKFTDLAGLLVAAGRGGAGRAASDFSPTPPEAIVADRPIPAPDHSLTHVFAQQELPPQLSPPSTVWAQFRVAGVLRDQRVGFAEDIGPATRPGVLPRRRAQAYLDLVALDAAPAAEPVALPSHDRALEAALEKVADEAVPPVPIAGIGCEQPRHAGPKVARVIGPKQQVEVLGQDAIRILLFPDRSGLSVHPAVMPALVSKGQAGCNSLS